MNIGTGREYLPVSLRGGMSNGTGIATIISQIFSRVERICFSKPLKLPLKVGVWEYGLLSNIVFYCYAPSNMLC